MVSTFIRYFFGFLISFTLAHAIAAAPDRVLEFQDVKLVLQDKPCDIGALIALVAPENRHLLKGGKVISKEGKSPSKLCYAEFPEMGILSVEDEHGNRGLFMIEDFEPAKDPLPKGNVNI